MVVVFLVWVDDVVMVVGSNVVVLFEISVFVGCDKSSGSYNVISISGVMCIDILLMELLQLVCVMIIQQIEDLGVVCLVDMVDYVSGISCFNDFGGIWDNFVICGFSSIDMGFLVNGFFGLCGYNLCCDMVMIECIEFFKGLVVVFYGSSELGGIINIVIKKL